MNLNSTVSKSFYAVALMAFGVMHFIVGSFVTGRPVEWPEWLPGQFYVSLLAGLLLVLVGAGVLIGREMRRGLLAVAILILFWAALRNIHALILEPNFGLLLTNIGKGLTLGSGALFIIGRSFRRANKHENRNQFILAITCKYSTGFFLLVSGVQHFLFRDFVQYLIPSWIPWAAFWTYFSGVALITTGISLFTGIKIQLTSSLAGWMIFIWVFVLHIPRVVKNPSDQNEWISVFEAMAVSGILFLISIDAHNRAKRDDDLALL